MGASGQDMLSFHDKIQAQWKLASAEKDREALGTASLSSGSWGAGHETRVAGAKASGAAAARAEAEEGGLTAKTSTMSIPLGPDLLMVFPPKMHTLLMRQEEIAEGSALRAESAWPTTPRSESEGSLDLVQQ